MPHHTPGYTGAVPGLRESFGKTYGQSTTRALEGAPEKITQALRASDELTANGSMVETEGLHPVHDRPPPEESRPPGYTGHVPMFKQPIGKTYGFSVRVANKRSEKERERNEVLDTTAWSPSAQPGGVVAVPKSDVFSPGQTDIRRPLDAPEAQKVNNPPPGYTGYVRGSQHHFGRSFGNLYRKSQEYESRPGGYSAWNDPKNLDEHKTKELDPSANFPAGYGGWIPEGKDDFGKTFGRLSQERIKVVREKAKATPRSKSLSPKKSSAPPASIDAHGSAANTYGSWMQSPSAKSDVSPDETRRFLEDPNSVTPVQRKRVKDFLYGTPPTRGRVPGYTGHTPGSLNHVGETYGETTRRCEDDLEKKAQHVMEDMYMLDLRQNADSMASPPEKPRILGYTGYTPGSKFAFGKTYGIVSELSESERWSQGKQNAALAIANAEKAKRPQVCLKESVENPKQPPVGGRMPGWSGYIPRGEHILGKTYGETTRRAEDGLRKEMAGEGMKAYVEPAPQLDGLVTKPPGYAGFLPHAKDDFGKTFGMLSNATHTRTHQSPIARQLF